MNWLRFVDVGIFLALGATAASHWHNDRHHWIGVVIAIPAFCLWMLARHQLGDSFAVRAEARKLVTHGLYAKIRNPIYLFGGLAFFGVLVTLGSYIGAGVVVFMGWFQHLRVKREEQVLAEAFGEQYQAYRSKTWF